MYFLKYPTAFFQPKNSYLQLKLASLYPFKDSLLSQPPNQLRHLTKSKTKSKNKTSAKIITNHRANFLSYLNADKILNFNIITPDQMLSVSTIFLCSITLYLLGVIFTQVFQGTPVPPTQPLNISNIPLSLPEGLVFHQNTTQLFPELQIPKNNTPENPRTFTNPLLAFKILQQLDIAKPVSNSYFPKGEPTYDTYFMGLRKNENYCEEHRKFFVENSELFFNQINALHGFKFGSFVRDQVIPGIAHDIQPEIRRGTEPPEDYPQSPEVTIYFITSIMFPHRKIGKHYSCSSQASNHIPGDGYMNRKDYAAESAMNYTAKYKDQPQCLEEITFFPKTWLMNDKEQCQEWFAIINSPEYAKQKAERRIVYMRKNGAGGHVGSGVQPVNQEEEDRLIEKYKNGKRCGRYQKSHIIQEYIPNPLLIHGRKFDFRIYMLVASSNPLIVYYHDGFLRVSIAQYDVQSDDKQVFLTNLGLSSKIYKNVRKGNLYDGMNEEELKIHQQWSMERLQEYLLQQGVISDPNWLDNYLRPQFKKAFVHLIRTFGDRLHEDSTLYELWGLDYMLDSDLNLWFIEANSNPSLSGYSEPMGKFISKMLQDHFRIIHGLLKSRITRIIGYVNKMMEEEGVVVVGIDGEIVIKNLEERRKEFEELMKNRFEKEFEPTPENGFVKIVDGTLEKDAMYLGHIKPGCI